MNIPTQAIESTEMLNHGVVLHWLYNHNIYAIQLNEDSPEAIEVWFNKVTELLKGFPRDSVVLSLHDFTKIAFQAYGRQKGEALSRTIPPYLTVYIALVLPQNTMGRLMAVVANMTARLLPQRSTMRVFFSHQTALEWLQKNQCLARA